MKQWKWKQRISSEIFGMKYKFHRDGIEQVFNDVATVVSSAETDEKMKELAKENFNRIMNEEKFIPAGRILANAWPNSPIKNYMNCYTIGIDDSMEDIYDSLKEDAMISKVGGGVGFDLSNLRPKAADLSVGGVSSGPISFAKIFDASAKVIMTGGARRAAHIALMDVSHPDIEEFITVKQGDTNKVLTQFNISVKVTDKFVKAVEEDADWDLVFEDKVYKTVKAKYLYDLMSDNAYQHNEPGIFNVDRVNEFNNGSWAFDINEVNPCGEICMPRYSICCLSALNLGTFVKNKFQDNAYFDYEDFAETIGWGIRFLDNVLSVAEYPLEKIEENALGWRRVGLGFTALGNVFQYMKTPYGSDLSKDISEKIATVLRDASYKASALLAKEKGKFPFYDERLNDQNFIKTLPDELRELIKENGLRNIAMNTIAPTGTTALSIGQNCSSGIEPTFSLGYTRNYRTGHGDEQASEAVYDRAWLEYLETIKGGNVTDEEVKLEKPDWFSTVPDVGVYDSIDIQAIFQKYIDHSISKTLNLPPGTTKEEYNDLFMYAYKKGLKGFTSFNPSGSIKGILEYNEPTEVVVEEGIPETVARHMAPERPLELECDIHEITVNKAKHIVLVGKLHGSLYEIFVDDNSDGSIDVKHHKHGIIKKNGKGQYSLIVKNGTERCAVDNLAKTFDGTYGSLARLVSMSLRHGTPLQFIVQQLGKSKEFVGFEKSVARVLKKYIKEGELVQTGEVCPTCDSKLEFREGCVMCPSCGFSKCG